MKFTKHIYCGNCESSRTYRFDRGTDLRGKRIECAHCGVLIHATTAAAVRSTAEQKEPWAFLRDFFGMKSK